MRLSRGFAIAAGLCLVVPALFVGCFAPADDCLNTLTCPSIGTSSGGDGGGGGADVTPLECIPSQANGPVGDKCGGIFVASSTGADTNSGSRATPVATLGKAIELALAGNKRVYACADTFTEAVVVPAGIEIYGGLDCKTGWSYTEAARTLLTSAADEVPLKLSSGVEGTTKIENVSVTALDAKKAGGSSIAVIIDNVTAALTRCDFIAGNGVAGADGEMPIDTPEVGEGGGAGSDTCVAPAGGVPGVKTCGADMTSGGLGGNGGITAIDMGAGQGGLDGQPPDVMAGKGGAGAAAIAGRSVSARNGRPGRRRGRERRGRDIAREHFNRRLYGRGREGRRHRPPRSRRRRRRRLQIRSDG
jgi:hypothetical protein